MLQQLNAYFDNIYVITLKRSTDRHQHIKTELEGLSFEWFFGVDKQDLDSNELIQKGLYNPSEAKKNHPVGKQLTLGEIACALSHSLVYQDVIKKKYNKVLILEDDVVIDKEKINLFNNAIHELPKQWHLWYLGFAKNEKPPANAWIKKWFYHVLVSAGLKQNMNHTVVDHLYPAPYSQHLKEAGFHDCTHAYAITQHAAALLLKQQSPVQYTADNLLAFTITNQLLQAYISQPVLIYQQYQVQQISSSYVK